MHKYLIRKAELSDVPEIQNVIRVAMAQYIKDSGIPSTLDSMTESQADLEKYICNDYFLIAFYEKKPAGTLRVSAISEREAYISRFAVLPSMQKLGIGSRLFEAAENYLKENGFLSVSLHTSLNNTALVRFYTARHFVLQETKTDRGYPRGLFVKKY